MTVLLQQMLSILHQLTRQGKCHGALDLRNVVLAPTGCFGLLAARVECDRGLLWLRRPRQNPPRSDAHCLVDVLGALLSLDAEVAMAQRMPTQIPPGIHHKVRSLLHALRRTQPGPLRHARP